MVLRAEALEPRDCPSAFALVRNGTRPADVEQGQAADCAFLAAPAGAAAMAGAGGVTFSPAGVLADAAAVGPAARTVDHARLPGTTADRAGLAGTSRDTVPLTSAAADRVNF